MKIKFILILLLLAFTTVVYSQSVLINEVMSDNESTITDNDGDFVDYVELYNSGDDEINLAQFSLSDDSNIWYFPDTVLSSKSFILVYASGKDKFDVNELHTNFKISKNGESLTIHRGAEIIQKVNVPSLSPDEVYASLPDGNSTLSIFRRPTPGSTNNSSDILVLNPITGIYNDEVNVSMLSRLGYDVYYTLNGRDPDTTCIKYDNEIILTKNITTNKWCNIVTTAEQSELSYKAWTVPILKQEKAHVLKAASFLNGNRVSDVVISSYFIDVENDNLPIVSIVVDSSYLFDYQEGIYVTGVNFDENNPEFSGNSFLKGREHEKLAHIAMIESGGELVLTQNAGLRIHGGKTRQAAQKSLKFYARDEYGKSEFNYQIFPERDIESYKGFLLRSCMGAWLDNSLITDDVVQYICKDLDVDSQLSRPVSLFINGEYWGIQVLKDKLDEDYLSSLTGIDKDSIIIASQGDGKIDYLINYAEEHDLKELSHFEYMLRELDVNNFIDYYIAQQYFINMDWPANNNKYWKSVNGKWRWILFDTDACMLDVNSNMLEFCMLNDPSIKWPNSPMSTALFRNLMRNDDFSLKFKERYIELLKTTFTFDNMSQKLKYIYSLYVDDIEKYIDRWDTPTSINDWKNVINIDMMNFLRDRSCITIDHLEIFYDEKIGDLCGEQVEPISDNMFSIFPTLVTDQFYIVNNTEELHNVEIEIHTKVGELVYKGHKSIEARHEVNLRFSLISGIYSVRLKNNGLSYLHRIIVY